MGVLKIRCPILLSSKVLETREASFRRGPQPPPAAPLRGRREIVRRPKNQKNHWFYKVFRILGHHVRYPGSSWLILAYMTPPRRSKTPQDASKTPQDSPFCLQDASKTLQQISESQWFIRFSLLFRILGHHLAMLAHLGSS